VTQTGWSADMIAARTRKLCDFVWDELQLPPPRTPRQKS